MDIGSNKPTAAERAAVRYHLLDVCDPDEREYTAADFALQVPRPPGGRLRNGPAPLWVRVSPSARAGRECAAADFAFRSGGKDPSPEM